MEDRNNSLVVIVDTVLLIIVWMRFHSHSALQVKLWSANIKIVLWLTPIYIVDREIQRSLVKSIMLVFVCAKQTNEQCGPCKSSHNKIQFLMMWLLRKLHKSLKKSKSTICLCKWKNANRRFAFLLCFLNLLQEAQK